MDGLSRPSLGRVHLQGLMNVVAIVIFEVLCQNPTEMRPRGTYSSPIQNQRHELKRLLLGHSLQQFRHIFQG